MSTKSHPDCRSQNEKLVDMTWQDNRRTLTNEIFEDELIPVPSISTAQCFGLFSVFVKSKPESFGQKVKSSLIAPTYHVIGHLSQVIQLEKTDLDRLLSSSRPHVEDCNTPKFECFLSTYGHSIQLNLEKISKFIIPLILAEGDLYLNNKIPDLASAKSVYIVTDVMTAGDVSAFITGDDDSFHRMTLGSRPIGFGYSKFRLARDGLVGEQESCTLRFNGKWKVVVDRLADYLNELRTDEDVADDTDEDDDEDGEQQREDNEEPDD